MRGVGKGVGQPAVVQQDLNGCNIDAIVAGSMLQFVCDAGSSAQFDQQSM